MIDITNGLATSIIVGIIAIVILIASAETAVTKILRLLGHFGFSKTFGGLTIFSVVTSLPEIFAHGVASWGILRGTYDFQIASATVLGANIGSDVVQQTLILGLVVLLMGGLYFKKEFLMTAYLPMIGTTLMCIILGWDGLYSRVDGAILVGSFIGYMIFLYTRERKNHVPKIENHVNVGRDTIVALGSMAAMLVSAHVLLTTSQRLVELTGLGGSLIGVVSLGVASAAPELFTALSGIRHKAEGMSLGTLIGSNITNPLVAIGGGALASTYWVPKALVLWDLPMETITAALLFGYLMVTNRRLGRWGGVYLVCLYIAYLIVRVTFFSIDVGMV